MKGNAKVITMLNGLLADELTAINQYLVHKGMAENWGYAEFSKYIDGRIASEREHAQELIDRILFLEGAPVTSTLNAIATGDDVPAGLFADLKSELTAVAMTIGYVAVGRPSCLGNTDDLRVLFKRWGVRRMVVVADNDEAKRRPDNSLWYPGREGAMMLVKAMGGVEYKLLMTPTKDIRKWVCNGVTRRECDDVVTVLRWKSGGSHGDEGH